jgi:subfamily B ATP-binding cassette protein MsbA
MRDAFWPFAGRMLRYRWLVLAALLFAALSAGGLGAGLAGMKPVLDNVLDRDGESLFLLAAAHNERLAAHPSAWSVAVPGWVAERLPRDAFGTVLWTVVGLGVLTVIGAACNFMHAYLSLTVISRTVANVRREAFHRVVHLPLKTVLKAGPSDLISRIVYDTAQLGQGFNALLSRSLAQATKALAAVITALCLDWRLTLITVPACLVIGVVVGKLGKRIRRASKKALASQSGLYLSASEVLGGLRVVKVHTTERAEAGRFHRSNKEVVAQEFKVRTARALASPLVETITIVMFGAMALVAVKAILDGALDRSNTLLVLGALGLAAAQAKPLTGFHNDIQQASAAAGRLRELLGTPEEEGHGAALPRLARPSKGIEFREVRLTYPGAERPALGGVSLVVPHGRTYAFVGPNGCGKTTLLSLIPRLFDPDAGAVLIDGTDVRSVNVRSLRRHISVVTQETVLFRGSLRDNIAYGMAGATDEQVRAAARRARAEEFILEKPGGYAFEVGEGGAGLSGGQRQRIAIARAILRDPAILILDEATSMIDAESEAKIAEAIAEFVGGGGAEARDGHAPGSNGTPAGAGGAAGAGRGRTCLIVAHRLSTVIDADAIVVMNAGRIEDVGTHRELLERSAVYAGLVSNQLVRA